ncbi:MAG: aldehyde ferredoxin oxidoreductase family protein [Nitrososphaeria archaeon]
MYVTEGKILRIDLSKPKIAYEDFTQYHKRFMGGRGVNQYIIFNEMPYNTLPLDPSNPIAVGAGLLCGTYAPGASRVSIDSKNLFTGGIGSANVGGNLGSSMRKAGITNIIVYGKAKELSYLVVDDGEARLRAAGDLRLKTISEAEKIIKEKEGDDFHVMCIGPAGENLVYGACVIVDGARSASRCGIGAIFGSKNLKAVAVRGTRELTVKDVNAFETACRQCVKTLDSDTFNKRRKKFGVYCYDAPWQIETPYRNFSGRVPSEKKKRSLMPEEFYKFKVGEKSCDGCPIACWSLHEISYDDEHLQVEALQGNTIHNFGAKLDMDRPEDILVAHNLCNEYGLDEDVTSNVIAWAIDCYENGLLTNKDTHGLKLEWGSTQCVYDLIKAIAYREGVGDLLAEGCKRASEKIGGNASDMCTHINGNDLFECLWLSVAWALGVTVSPRGGTHTRGGVIEERLHGASAETLIKLFGICSIEEPSSYVNKERLVVYMERLNAALDCLGMCMFTHSSRISMLSPDDYSRLVSAAVGKDFSASDLLLVGERVHTVERSYNVLHIGWSRRNDIPPQIFMTRPLDGRYNLKYDQYNLLLDRYYDHHCWDSDGRPKKKTLEALGLGEVAERFIQKGIVIS